LWVLPRLSVASFVSGGFFNNDALPFTAFCRLPRLAAGWCFSCVRGFFLIAGFVRCCNVSVFWMLAFSAGFQIKGFHFLILSYLAHGYNALLRVLMIEPGYSWFKRFGSWAGLLDRFTVPHHFGGLYHGWCYPG